MADSALPRNATCEFAVALEGLRAALALPHGQFAGLSVYRSPKGVSLRVRWEFPGAPCDHGTAVKKKKRLSPSKRRRSENRGRAHGERKKREGEGQQPGHQQQPPPSPLNPTAPPFNPGLPPTSNPVTSPPPTPSRTARHTRQRDGMAGNGESVGGGGEDARSPAKKKRVSEGTDGRQEGQRADQ